MKKIYRRMAIMGGMLALMAMPIKAQKWEHLAETPQMGWSTWNKFQGKMTRCDSMPAVATGTTRTCWRWVTA